MRELSKPERMVTAAQGFKNMEAPMAEAKRGLGLPKETLPGSDPLTPQQDHSPCPAALGSAEACDSQWR